MVKMTIFVGLLLGLIQGLTEFLPVSSTAHLTIAHKLLAGEDPSSASSPSVPNHTEDEAWLAVDVMLHLGTLLAVLVYFRVEVLRLIRAFFALCLTPFSPHRPLPGSPQQDDRRLLIFMIFASIATALIMLAFEKIHFIHNALAPLHENLVAIGLFLIIGGAVLYTTRAFTAPGRELARCRPLDAIIIGVVQALAGIFPGLSRSGSTISTGIFCRFDRKLAARFSFLISIPAIVGAALFEARNVNFSVMPHIIPALVAGVIVAAISGYFAISVIFRVIQGRKFSWFAPYCWLAGVTFVVIGLLKIA